MAKAPEISIVTETFNIAEGQGVESTRVALAYVFGLADRRGDIEVLLADSMEPNLLVDDLRRTFPRLRHVHAPGAGYEGIKNLAAQEARGQFVVYLDSDCRPVDERWLDALLAPLREGRGAASAGVTRYEGTTLLRRVMSVLDFGYLLAAEADELGCYASNNCAFTREIRVEVPAPDGPMRCTCYAHAQQLTRSGRPLVRAPEAVAVHALPPVFKERWRRGYDLVAACWVNPELAETRWLRLGVLAAPLFIAANLAEDWRRLGRVAGPWGWSPAVLLGARALAAVLRLIDFGGTVRALAFGADPRWSAYGAAAAESAPRLAKGRDSA
ncbi:MAG: glycosyltransferase [Reyranellaceae bacterium]